MNTFRIFYIKFIHRNIIFYLLSSKFFGMSVLFVSNGGRWAGFIHSGKPIIRFILFQAVDKRSMKIF